MQIHSHFTCITQTCQCVDPPQGVITGNWGLVKMHLDFMQLQSMTVHPYKLCRVTVSRASQSCCCHLDKSIDRQCALVLSSQGELLLT